MPREHQHKVLTFGIILALILRAIFIAIGATLLSLFSFMFLIFGLLLIWTAAQLYRHRNEDPDMNDNILVRTTRRVLPVSDTYVGGKLLARVDGRRVVTPVSLVVILGVLTVTTIASLVKSRNDPTQRARAGVVIGHPTRSRQDQPQPGSSTAPGS